VNINSERIGKRNSKPRLADPAQDVEASTQPPEQPSPFWDVGGASAAEAFTQPEIEQASELEKAKGMSVSKRMTLGQRIALPNTAEIGNKYGEDIQRAVEKTGAELMQMTPLDRLNWRYPFLGLVRLPDELRKTLGEPDGDVCLEYYRRFVGAIKSEDDVSDEPLSILLELLKKHPIEFQCSGWVCFAVGYIVLGYPNFKNCHARAKKLFAHYWRDMNSPKHQKWGQRWLQMFKGRQKLDSPHVRHWRRAVTWMEKAAERGLAGTKWFDEYAKSHSKRCDCLNERSFQVLRRAYVKVARRYEDSPPPSAVVLEAAAAEHRVSARALAQFRADAKKRTRNSQ